MIVSKIDFGQETKETINFNFSKPLDTFFIEIGKKATLRNFHTALLNEKIIDSINTDFYDNHIVLPNGLTIFKHFFSLIEREYESFGLSQMDFPFVANNKIFTLNNLLNLNNKLLHIGNDDSFISNTPIGTLIPTGEQQIYTYWSKILNNKKQLPFKIYRKAKFFRPLSKRKIKGIFKSLEASDVYEFHCAYSDKSIQQSELLKSLKAFKKIYSSAFLPVICTQRPLWTNNYKVSEDTYGFDVLLPNNRTLQVGSIYNQNQIFSKAYNISFEDNEKFFYTNQLTGALSRRMILSHFFLGLKTNNHISIHPNFVPIQVEIVVKGQLETTCNEYMLKALQECGMRYSINTKVSSNNLAAITILLFPKRKEGDKYKIVFIRNDYRSEFSIYTNNITDFIKMSKNILILIGNDYIRRLKKFYSNNINQEKIGDKPINIVPACSKKTIVFALEKQFQGEVLGFVDTEFVECCFISKEETNKLAIIAKRI